MFELRDMTELFFTCLLSCFENSGFSVLEFSIVHYDFFDDRLTQVLTNPT